MRINFHTYKTYLECPKKYKYVEDRVPPPQPDNMYFALYGKTIEKFFQGYCNDWGPAGIEFDKELVINYLTPIYKKILHYNEVDWGAPFVKLSSQDIFDSVVIDILECLNVFTVFKKTRSETSFKVTLKNGDYINGRVDFLYTTDNGEVELLDGKGTDTLNKNIEPEQLFMYALMYYFTRKKLPNRIGFLYYKLRHIQYLDFDLKTIDTFRKKLLLVLQAIRSDTKFIGTPSTKACKYCQYKTICSEYSQRKIDRQKKSKIQFETNGDPIELGL